MGYKFGKRSTENRSEIHADLKKFLDALIKHRDCSIVEGRRGEIEQNHMFKIGTSKLKYPDSKHNCEEDELSEAVDIWPYPRPAWDDTQAWKEFSLFASGVAAGIGIEIINGGLSWGWDYPHWELKS